MSRLLLICGLLVMMTACSRADLYTRQPERQANEMLSVLQASGIDAAKQEVKDAGWTVTAPAADFPRAIQILNAHGYPRDDFDSLGSVFKKDGFASSPVEERARFIFALGQELSRTISAIDGVVQARVQLALPEAEALTGDRRPASASVFIRYRRGVDLSDRISSIKGLIINAVEGVTYDRVTVELFEATPLALPPSVPEAWSFGQIALIVSALLLALAAIVGVTILVGRQRRFRATTAQDRGILREDSALQDATAGREPVR